MLPAANPQIESFVIVATAMVFMGGAGVQAVYRPVLYSFILPAFQPAEKRVVMPLLMAVPVLFIAGAVFAYFVVMPAALDFLLGFNADAFRIEIRGSAGPVPVITEAVR